MGEGEGGEEGGLKGAKGENKTRYIVVSIELTMYRMYNVQNVQCTECTMYRMYNVQD